MKTGIAFSGGGLKCVAHLGILQVLNDNKIPIHQTVGTSAGSIVAAAWALGIKPQELLQEIKKLRPIDVYDFPWWVFLLWELYQLLPYLSGRPQSTFSSAPQGLISGNKLEKWLKSIFGEITMNHITVPLAITATDINSGQLVVFISRGYEKVSVPLASPTITYIKGAKLIEAIRASASIPGLFVPKQLAGRMLVDGGVTNNLPADILYNLGCHKILGVDLGQYDNLTKPVGNVADIAVKSLELMIQSTSSLTSSTFCDLTLNPQTGSIPLFDLTGVEETFQIGIRTGTWALPEIKRIFT